MKSKNGFTLVEIMFAVAIIGLLASIGIPAILNALGNAQEKTRAAHIASIETAKSMLTLPELVYAYGRGLIEGAEFGDDEYTEENLMACLKNAEQLEDLIVGGQYLVPGDIGEKAYYTGNQPTFYTK